MAEVLPAGPATYALRRLLWRMVWESQEIVETQAILVSHAYSGLRGKLSARAVPVVQCLGHGVERT